MSKMENIDKKFMEKVVTDEERIALAAKLDKELDDFINGLEKRQYTEGWPEDRWEEEMEKHPFFMTKPPEPGDELHPLLQGIQQLKYDPEENTAEDVHNHRFPRPETDMARFTVWLHNLNMVFCLADALSIWKNKRVCSAHFENCYKSPGNPRLFPNAIPTLNLPGPAAPAPPENPNVIDNDIEGPATPAPPEYPNVVVNDIEGPATPAPPEYPNVVVNDIEGPATPAPPEYPNVVDNDIEGSSGGRSNCAAHGMRIY